MNCKHCGIEVPSNFSFCPECKYSISQDQPGNRTSQNQGIEFGSLIAQCKFKPAHHFLLGRKLALKGEGELRFYSSGVSFNSELQKSDTKSVLVSALMAIISFPFLGTRGATLVAKQTYDQASGTQMLGNECTCIDYRDMKDFVWDGAKRRIAIYISNNENKGWIQADLVDTNSNFNNILSGHIPAGSKNKRIYHADAVGLVILFGLFFLGLSIAFLSAYF